MIQELIQEVVEQYIYEPNDMNTRTLIAEEIEERIAEESGEDVYVSIKSSLDGLHVCGKVFFYCMEGEDKGEVYKAISFNAGPFEE